MGFTEKELQREGGGGELEVKKWMIAGIPVRSPLKPIFTKAPPPQKQIEEEEEENSGSTPTSKDSRIPSRLACPPPPPRKKPKTSSSSSSCSSVGIRDQFFTPPDDFENLFTRTPLHNLKRPTYLST